MICLHLGRVVWRGLLPNQTVHDPQQVYFFFCLISGCKILQNLFFQKNIISTLKRQCYRLFFLIEQAVVALILCAFSD